MKSIIIALVLLLGIIYVADQVFAAQPKVMIFTASWCNTCKIMEQTTFMDPGVKAALRKYSVIRVDTSVPNATQKSHNVIAVPTILVFNAQGREVKRFVGYVSAETLRSVL